MISLSLGPVRGDEVASSEGVLHLKEKVQHTDPSVLFSIANDISKVVRYILMNNTSDTAGDIPPPLPIVVLLKRTELCTFCKFLEALNVGMEWLNGNGISA